MSNLFKVVSETVRISESVRPMGGIYVRIINETARISETKLPLGAIYEHIANKTVRITERIIVKGARFFIPKSETSSISENVTFILTQSNWTDPTYYQTNDVPTTSGPERLNINTKIIDKIITLFDYLHGDDVQQFHFKNNTGSDLTLQIGDTGRGIRILDQNGDRVLRIDEFGEITEGKFDASVLSMQFAGTQVVQNKVSNIRVPFPYTAVCTSLVMTCDDSTPPTGASLIYRLNKDGIAFGTVSIASGSTIGSTSISSSIAKNSIITYDCTSIGSSIPGNDIYIQVRGYRTGTIPP